MSFILQIRSHVTNFLFLFRYFHHDRSRGSSYFPKFFEDNVAQPVFVALKDLLQKYANYELSDPRLIYHTFVYFSKVVYHDGTRANLRRVIQVVSILA